MTTEDHIAAVTAVYPQACVQSLGLVSRIVKFEGATDEDALGFYYRLPESAWANAFNQLASANN
jgi:hypothetical protein